MKPNHQLTAQRLPNDGSSRKSSYAGWAGVRIELYTVASMDDLLFGAGGGGGGGPERFFRNLPPVTRIWLMSTLLVTALANFDFVKWTDLGCGGWHDVWGSGGRAEIWRLLTCFIYAGKFGWSALIGLHLMTQISTRYETMGPICTRRIHIDPDRRMAQENDADAERIRENRYPYYDRGESSDYAFALLFGMCGILLSNFYMLPRLPSFITQGRHHVFYHRHLTHFVVYIWSRQHPHHRVNLFGVSMSAAYLPFSYLLMGYALNNGQSIPVEILHGMVVGHVYFYLACVVPRVLGGRRALLSTPAALVDFFDWLEGRGPAGIDGREGGDGPALVDVDGVIGG